MLGTSIVWVPMALFMALDGNVVKAIVFLISASIVVSTLDNFIRPMVLGEQLKIHPLLLFFSITGGLAVFGFNGIILGPLILTIFIAAGELYRALNEEGESAPKKEESTP